MTHSTKPDKPYPDFPLFAHANGQWAKKIRGKFHYFGLWAEPNAALQKYLDERDALQAGRTPRPTPGALTVKTAMNHFLNAKRQLVDSGELTPRTWADYQGTCQRVSDAFGGDRPVDDLRPDDFAALRAELAKRWGPVALGNEIQRVRSVFKHAYDAGLIDAPFRFGPGFKRPSKKTLRQSRAEKGPRMYEAAELSKIVAAAKQPLKAMILLGINCGFGNADCATLPIKSLDLKAGWVSYPRPKTGIERRCPLWPETVAALRDALAQRYTPKDEADADLVFVTKFKTSWSKSSDGNNHAEPIGLELKKLLRQLKLYRAGLGFYALRHTFRTIADESRDQVAVDHVMGHAREDMASVYRERIGDDRLKAVTDHVRAWLFPPPDKGRTQN